MNIEPSILDEVDFDNIVFDYTYQKRGTKSDKAIVRYVPSQKYLVFNPKMTNLLDLLDERQAVIGLSGDIVVLKMTDAETFGSVPFRKPHSPKTASERTENSRAIYVGHLLKNPCNKFERFYRAERNGNMVFLKPAMVE